MNRTSAHWPLAGLGSILLVAAGCGSSPAPHPGSDSATCTPVLPGPSPLRRLTHLEYDNSLRDLVGDDSRPSSGFPPDDRASIFANDASAQTVTRLLAEGYLHAAEDVAGRAVTHLGDLLPCAGEIAAASSDPDRESACAQAFIDSVGERAFRRPLDDDDRADLLDAFTRGRAESGAPDGDFVAGIESLLEVLLQSPEYLYRVELGRQDGMHPAASRAPQAAGPTSNAVALTPWELASRLSYLFWETMPDGPLFAAAASGQLETADQVESQAERLLADPRARVTFAHFFEQFLELDQLDLLEKDPSIYSTFEPALRDAFRAETLAFVDSVMWNGDGRLFTLFTAPYTFVNGKLAAFYGMPTVDGSTFRRVDVDVSRRGGLLTQGSFLAIHAKFDQTSPVTRGKFVRERLFCTSPPPPPANLAIHAPDLDPRLTTRQRFEQHATDPFCASCHHLMDPIGLGLENFDGAGAWRDTESGQPVDSSGQLEGTDIDGTFHGARELEERLATSSQVERCAMMQWFHFAAGRSDTPDDACTLDELAGAFHRSGGDLRALLLSLTQTDAFLYRTSAP